MTSVAPPPSLPLHPRERSSKPNSMLRNSGCVLRKMGPEPAKRTKSRFPALFDLVADPSIVFQLVNGGAVMIAGGGR